MAGYLRRLTPYRRVGGYISGGSAAQPGSYPTTTSAVWSLDDLYLRRVGPLLDSYPNAAAAYSLRSLTSAHTGPVVTVRRSTDSAEAEFTASEVSDGTLAAWCGGGDGFVKTWHDQSQNGRDATQTTASNQPQIVDSGALITEGGKAAVQFDGVDDWLSPGVKIFKGLIEASAFSVQNLLGSSFETAYSEYQTSGKRTVLYRQTDATSRLLIIGDASDSAMAITYSGVPNASHVFAFTYNDGTTSAYENGAIVGTDATLSGALDDSERNFFIGARDSVTEHGNVAMQELIIYPSDMTAIRTRIEGNINRHFGVF